MSHTLNGRAALPRRPESGAPIFNRLSASLRTVEPTTSRLGAPIFNRLSASSRIVEPAASWLGAPIFNRLSPSSRTVEPTASRRSGRVSPYRVGGRLPLEFLRACARLGVAPGRFVLVVNIARQTTALFERGALKKTFRCSTSKFGIGERAGSNRTPRGLHRVAEKIGGGWPAGTAFKGRKPAGFTWRGNPAATITSRILWLEGLEPGFNRAGGVDSHARFIYIHGTGNEPALGRPDSHGCVHLAAQDLIPLYDKLPPGSLVWLSEN